MKGNRSQHGECPGFEELRAGGWPVPAPVKMHMHNLDPESGANCGFCCVYIFTGVGTRRCFASVAGPFQGQPAEFIF